MAEGFPVIAVLASGAASRFGGGKLQARLGGKPLAQHAIDAALSHGLPVAIIVRADEEPHWRETFPRCQVVGNRVADRGIGTSIRCAADWASSSRANGIVLLLADMPFVPGSLIGDLVDSALQEQRAACRYPTGALGVPAAFPKAELQALAQIADHKGAKHLLAKPATLVLHPPPAALIDIDTQADLIKATKLAARSTCVH